MSVQIRWMGWVSINEVDGWVSVNKMDGVGQYK